PSSRAARMAGDAESAAPARRRRPGASSTAPAAHPRLPPHGRRRVRAAGLGSGVPHIRRGDGAADGADGAPLRRALPEGRMTNDASDTLATARRLVRIVDAFLYVWIVARLIAPWIGAA